jgi:hypothetical protein
MTEQSSYIPGVTTPPPREKVREQWSAQECLDYARDGVVPDSDAYKQFVREVHVEAGLEPPEGTGEPKALEDLSAGELYERARGR